MKKLILFTVLFCSLRVMSQHCDTSCTLDVITTNGNTTWQHCNFNNGVNFSSGDIEFSYDINLYMDGSAPIVFNNHNKSVSFFAPNTLLSNYFIVLPDSLLSGADTLALSIGGVSANHTGDVPMQSILSAFTIGNSYPDNTAAGIAGRTSGWWYFNTTTHSIVQIP